MGNDTFCISIDFGDSTILNAHNNFKVSSYYCFTQPEMKIHQLYCVDSVSIRRYTFYREVADTAVLIAEDKEIVNYSNIIARRVR